MLASNQRLIFITCVHLSGLLQNCFKGAADKHQQSCTNVGIKPTSGSTWTGTQVYQTLSLYLKMYINSVTNNTYLQKWNQPTAMQPQSTQNSRSTTLAENWKEQKHTQFNLQAVNKLSNQVNEWWGGSEYIDGTCSWPNDKSIKNIYMLLVRGLLVVGSQQGTEPNWHISTGRSAPIWTSMETRLSF